MVGTIHWKTIRLGLVLLTGLVVTWNYYAFNRFVHQPRHFHHNASSSTNHHGGGPPREGFYLQKDGLLLYGIAIPIAVLAVVTLLWKPKPNVLKPVVSDRHCKGEVNVRKWSFIWFLLPLLFVLLDSAHEAFVGSRDMERERMGWTWWNSVLTSFMSPTGYAAVWALAAFLVPVTKHSPILDWLHISPVEALEFHRMAGWTSLVFSILHGFLHLRHLMDVLRRGHPRPWHRELVILLVPPSWECVATQAPLQPLFSRTDQDQIFQSDKRCWLALVNATGMVSVMAFLVLAVTSLPRFRRYWYDAFYRVHIPMAWIMMLCAIWHYPTCALVLIPNVIFYLSFYVPIAVSHFVDALTRANPCPLQEAVWIQKGLVELTFATDTKDVVRHESRFVKVSHPAVSAVSHPFSIFSSQALRGQSNHPERPSAYSILYRSTGHFTTELTKILFPELTDNQGTIDQDSPADPLLSRRLSTGKIHFDAYYAGSYDWIDSAMNAHDEILLVAGGVGVVPFLSLLPLLNQRIVAACALSDLQLDEENSQQDEDRSFCGPRRIHFHWYCREVGLASYVWRKHLGPHVRNMWENHPNCQNRLSVHLHLTGLDRISDNVLSVDETETKVFPYPTRGPQNTQVRPVQDTRTRQSQLVGLLLPGSIMVGGIVMHWWWYKSFIIADEFRQENLVIRSHSIVFTFLLALVLSFAVEAYVRWCGNKNHDVPSYSAVSVEIDDVLERLEQEDPPLNESTALQVSAGRPRLQDVTRDILRAHRPGVYMCGPVSMMDRVEAFMEDERKGCAYYRENSEL